MELIRIGSRKQIQKGTRFVALMNILDSQEMRRVEKELLLMPAKPNYVLRKPTPLQMKDIALHKSSLFAAPSAQSESHVRRIVSLAESMVVVRLNDANSLFRMVLYSLLSIIYSNKNMKKAHNNDQQAHFLMDTVKCSLYSRDVDFNQIRNKRMEIDNQQAKAMAAQFFHLMQSLKHNPLIDPLKYAELVLELNPFIMQIFTLFFRFILVRLEIEQADDNTKTVNICQSITNLLEYFDLSYRNFGELLLFYEEGLFLAMREQELVFGIYYENEVERQNEKKAAQARKTKAHEIEDLKLGDMQRESTSKKKSRVVESDIKLFNFILDSGRSNETIKEDHLHERDVDMETPHFKDHNEQFNFGRKKKDEHQPVVFKPEEIRQEFERLIMDSSEEEKESVEEKFNPFEEPPTPFLGMMNGNTFMGFAKPGSCGSKDRSIKNIEIAETDGDKLEEKKLVDSPIEKLSDENFETNSKNHARVKRGNSKNLVSVKDKFQAPYSPQASKILTKNDVFSSLGADALFIFSDQKQVTMKSSLALPGLPRRMQAELFKCGCKIERVKRNIVVSKVVDFSYYPISFNKKRIHQTMISPRFLNFKSTANLRAFEPSHAGDSKKTSPARAKGEPSGNLLNNKTSQMREDRKPTFLKYLKKDRNEQPEKDKNAKQANEQTNQRLRWQKNKQSNMISNERFKRLSTIIGNHTSQQKSACKSTTKNAESLNKYHKMHTDQGTHIRLDRNTINARPGLGQPGTSWQTTSNFHQRATYYTQPGNTNNIANYYGQAQPTQNYNTHMKFFAPVQIISPAVYLDSANHQIRSPTMNVNGAVPKRKENPEVHRSQNIFQRPLEHKNERKQSVQSNKSEKVIKYSPKRV